VPVQQVREVVADSVHLIRGAARLADYHQVHGVYLDQQRAVARGQGSCRQDECPSALALDGSPEFLQAPGERDRVRAQGARALTSPPGPVAGRPSPSWSCRCGRPAEIRSIGTPASDMIETRCAAARAASSRPGSGLQP
jgi:hypothetical protein